MKMAGADERTISAITLILYSTPAITILNLIPIKRLVFVSLIF